MNLPIAVPAYKMFRMAHFAPEGAQGNVTYLDDVPLTWIPTLHFTRPGEQVYFADDFESHPAGGPVHGALAAKGGKWKVSPHKPNGYVIENRTSFDKGVRSVRCADAADLIAVGAEKLVLDGKVRITVDLDIFIRSASDFPFMIPNPATRSPHRTAVVLRRAFSGSPVASILAGDGAWRYWDGRRYVDSRVGIAYDVWNHVQLALDTSTGSCTIVVQPVGELPTLIGRVPMGKVAESGNELVFAISPADTSNHISCYDNVLIALR